MPIYGNPEISLYNGQLPKGCELCRLGSKLVVFITGLCDDNCYYCPVSEERFGKGVMYANEMKVNKLVDYIYEAYRMRALGAGITGGDPILEIGKVTKLIKMFKEEFGDNFHVHLYTTGRYVTHDILKALEKAGLDEIRFHPIKDEYLRAIEKALNYSFNVGIEIPSIPNNEDNIIKLVEWAKNKGVKFINLNELEMNLRNFSQLKPRGFIISHGLTGVKGSMETAKRIIEKFENIGITIHYCSAVYKDIVETRTRFLRISKYSRKAYEEMTNEGTIVRALVKSKIELSEFGEKESEYYSISPLIIDEILRKYNEYIDEVLLIEEHPDYNRLRVSENLLYRKSK